MMKNPFKKAYLYLELDKDQWEEIFITYPNTIPIAMRDGSTSEQKAVIQTIDEWLDGEGDLDAEITDEQREHVEDVRDDMVEEHLED
jgi:hypothetical protein